MEINIYFFIITLVIFSWNINGQQIESNATTTTTPPPTTLPTSVKPVTIYPYQTDGFNSDSVKSGPILIIDKKTLFISNLNYDGSQKANFLVGTGVPSSKGTLVPDENNSTAALHPYIGRNIYLQLSGNLTTDQIDYFAIWSSASKKNIGHVVLYENGSEDVRKNISEALGFHQRTKDNKTIFRVPKCCGVYEYRINATCVPTAAQLIISANVFESNETHIDSDKFRTDIEFIPYHYNLVCPNEKYYRLALDEAFTFGLLFNASLIYGDQFVHGILSHGEFCMDRSLDSNVKILICLEADEAPEAAHMYNLYFLLLVISAICFLLSALCYIFILKANDIYQKCFIGYSGSMTLTFLCLIILQKVNSNCIFVGILFFFSMLCSVTWLTCLCVDMIFVIKPITKFPDEKRVYYYISSSLAVPVILLIFSLAGDGSPDVPQSFVKMYSGTDMCNFGEVNLALFFVPIGLLLLISLVALCYTSYLISKNNNIRDYSWVHNKSNFKFRLRSCFLIWVTTCIWLLEAVVNVFSVATGLQFAIDLIEASHGIFVLFIFVLNKYTRKKIMRVLKKDEVKEQQKYNKILDELNKRESAHGNNQCKNSECADGDLELTERNHDKGENDKMLPNKEDPEGIQSESDLNDTKRDESIDIN